MQKKEKKKKKKKKKKKREKEKREPNDGYTSACSGLCLTWGEEQKQKESNNSIKMFKN